MTREEIEAQIEIKENRLEQIDPPRKKADITERQTLEKDIEELSKLLINIRNTLNGENK